MTVGSAVVIVCLVVLLVRAATAKSRRQRLELDAKNPRHHPAGVLERYTLETEPQAGERGGRLCIGVRRWRYRGRRGGWHAEGLVARRVVDADDPVELGEARAELEHTTELRNQAAWGLAHALQRPRWLTQGLLWRGRHPEYLYTVESGVRDGARSDQIELGVHVWHFGGTLGGWQRVAILKGVSVDPDDLVAFGEVRAELEAFVEQKNREAREAG